LQLTAIFKVDEKGVRKRSYGERSREEKLFKTGGGVVR